LFLLFAFCFFAGIRVALLLPGGVSAFALASAFC
jgi:hypothetical protein